jgi:four helix bundle protein
MATIKSFEEIESWINSSNLCVKIYEITKRDSFTKDYSLKDQIRRSAISIPSNIAEGFERESINSFIYFLLIAKGSCGELRTQLHLAYNLKYIEEKEYSNLVSDCLVISKQLSGFITYLRGVKKKPVV